MITAEKTAHRIRGLVVGNRSDKTVRVKIERRVRHPLYGENYASASQCASA